MAGPRIWCSGLAVELLTTSDLASAIATMDQIVNALGCTNTRLRQQQAD